MPTPAGIFLRHRLHAALALAGALAAILAGCVAPPPAETAAASGPPVGTGGEHPPFAPAGVYVAALPAGADDAEAETRELYLFPDRTYYHLAKGGDRQFDAVVDTGTWSYLEGELELVSYGEVSAPRGTRAYVAMVRTADLRGVRPTVSEDWNRQLWTAMTYPQVRTLAERETVALKRSLENEYGRYSPAAIPARFPMTGPAKGLRGSDGRIVVYDFTTIRLRGLPVKAARVEFSREFREVHIVGAIEVSPELRSTTEMIIYVDGVELPL